MLANGSSLETVNNLTTDDLNNLYAALRLGLWGPFMQGVIAYDIIYKLHEVTEIGRAYGLGKKFKPTPLAGFEKYFPTFDEAWTLGHGSALRRKKSDKEIATKAIMALGGKPPKWVTDALS